jgi:hypothetical protein
MFAVESSLTMPNSTTGPGDPGHGRTSDGATRGEAQAKAGCSTALRHEAPRALGSSYQPAGAVGWGGVVTTGEGYPPGWKAHLQRLRSTAAEPTCVTDRLVLRPRLRRFAPLAGSLCPTPTAPFPPPSLLSPCGNVTPRRAGRAGVAGTRAGRGTGKAPGRAGRGGRHGPGTARAGGDWIMATTDGACRPDAPSPARSPNPARPTTRLRHSWPSILVRPSAGGTGAVSKSGPEWGPTRNLSQRRSAVPPRGCTSSRHPPLGQASHKACSAPRRSRRSAVRFRRS